MNSPVEYAELAAKHGAPKFLKQIDALVVLWGDTIFAAGPCWADDKEVALRVKGIEVAIACVEDQARDFWMTRDDAE